MLCYLSRFDIVVRAIKKLGPSKTFVLSNRWRTIWGTSHDSGNSCKAYSSLFGGYKCPKKRFNKIVNNELG